MSNIREIQVDNTTYDIAAKNLVDGFTQSTAGVNALDAKAGKTLNDNKAAKVTPILYYKIGTNDNDPSGTAQEGANPHVELRNGGNATNGRGFAAVYTDASGNNTQNMIIDKNGVFLPAVFNRYAGFTTMSFTVSGSSTKTLTVENEARFIIIALGRYVSHQALVLGGANGSGDVAITVVQSATQLTFTEGKASATPPAPGANKLTIQNSHGSLTATCLCIMLGDTATVS